MQLQFELQLQTLLPPRSQNVCCRRSA